MYIKKQTKKIKNKKSYQQKSLVFVRIFKVINNIFKKKIWWIKKSFINLWQIINQ
jgi:hypothetical protein